MALVAGKKPPTSMLYPAQRRDGALLPIIECPTGHWLHPFARAEFSLSLKTRAPFERGLVDKTTDETLYEWT